MGGLGWQNTLPLNLGGDPSKTEEIYSALRAAVGKGGAGPKDSLEDLWRQSKAEVIASVVLMKERAILQAFPNVATDHIGVYEQILNLQPVGTDEDRRVAITTAWTLDMLANMPSLETSLQVIDPAFRLEEIAYGDTTLVHFGKAFPTRGYEAYGVPEYPNYSEDLVLRVRYMLASGRVNLDRMVRANAERLLNDVLPSWVDYYITTGAHFCCGGGVDGTSLLGLKTLGA
jgi:hypothetical protein